MRYGIVKSDSWGFSAFYLPTEKSFNLLFIHWFFYIEKELK